MILLRIQESVTLMTEEVRDEFKFTLSNLPSFDNSLVIYKFK